MGKVDQLERVLRSGIVAILRGNDGTRMADAAHALMAGGIDTLEVTFTVPQAERVLAEISRSLGSRILLGAGTVLDAATARLAFDSGAEFLVSPIVAPEVIAAARDADKLVFPGAFTPTEIVAAWRAGADIVKIFPSDSVGPAYLKALRAPLPQIRMMPTGGVNLDTAADFLAAGACVLGIGSSLVDPRLLASGDFTRLEALARQYVQVVTAARAQLAAR